MAWDGDWKHLTPLCYVCMNDGIGFYIWGLVREVWEGERLFTAIALAFCEVKICRPPRECSFIAFFCVFIHFFVVYYPSVSLAFLTSIINSLSTDNPDVSSYPWMSAVNITLPQLCCFLCSFSTNDTDSACGNVGTPKRKKRCWGICVKKCL